MLNIFARGLGRGFIAGLVAGFLFSLIILITNLLFAPSDVGKHAFTFQGYFGILVASCFISLFVFTFFGFLVGFTLMWFHKANLKTWLAMLLGLGSILIPTFWIFPLTISKIIEADNELYPDTHIYVQHLIYTLNAYLIVLWMSWSVHTNKYKFIKFKKKSRVPAYVNKEILSHIWHGQQGWQASRFDIDKELIERGYAPADIDAAWNFIAKGYVLREEDLLEV